jgi:hypothetical protein
MTHAIVFSSVYIRGLAEFCLSPLCLFSNAKYADFYDEMMMMMMMVIIIIIIIMALTASVV